MPGPMLSVSHAFFLPSSPPPQVRAVALLSPFNKKMRHQELRELPRPQRYWVLKGDLIPRLPASGTQAHTSGLCWKETLRQNA